MHRSMAALSAAAIFTIGMAAHATAQQADSLAALAARSGYIFQWLLPDRSVSLSRPGMLIVLRPGVVLYDVNDHVEVADRAPVTNHGDLLISPALAARLRTLANMGRSSTAPARSTILGSQAVQTAGGAVALEARALEGSEAVVVNGQTPGSAPVTITLFAIISPDLPTVFVSRHDIQTDQNGRFSGVIPIAADYMRGTVLRIVATSASGVSPATAQIVIGQPSPGATDLGSTP